MMDAVKRNFFARPFRRNSTIYKIKKALLWTEKNASERPVNIVSASQASDRVGAWMQWYEDIIGLTEVKTAQQNVLEAEAKFSTEQDKRREQQQLLTQIQSKLKNIDHELDKTPRGDDRFLDLLKDQHALYRQENTCQEQHNEHEKLERSYFTELCTAVRESHERERSRTERTKYWSVIGSAVGALLGILGATINSYLRNREIRKLGQTVQEKHDHIESVLVDFRSSFGVLGSPKDTVTVKVGNKGVDDKASENLSKIIKDSDLTRQISDIKQIVLAGNRGLSDGKIVYVGPQIKDMLNDTEKNLEYKIKINSLATVAFIYGAFALTIPVLYIYFRG